METIPSTTLDSAAAVVMLASIDANASARIPDRIKAVERELSDQLEAARLHGRVELGDYIRRAARLITLRNTLSDRLELSMPGSCKGRLSLADEVTTRCMQVRRWRTGDQIRAERARVISGARADLRQVEVDLLALQDGYQRGHGLVVPGPRAQLGMSDRADEFLNRGEVLIARRRRLLGRLAALDPFGDDGRAQRVEIALEAAGGVDKVAAAIGDRLQTAAVAKLAADRKRHAQLRAQADEVDPETERSVSLMAQWVESGSGLSKTEELAKREQGEAARAIVAAAQTGSFDGIVTLEQSLTSTNLAGLAKELVLARGEDGDWSAVLGELLGKAEGDG